MSKAKITKLKIEPIVRFVNEDKPHMVETLLHVENPPEIKSIGSIHVPGTNTYVSFVMTTKGTEVLSLEVGEPNLKLIADDEAKINFVHHVLAPKDYE